MVQFEESQGELKCKCANTFRQVFGERSLNDYEELLNENGETPQQYIHIDGCVIVTKKVLVNRKSGSVIPFIEFKERG